MDHLPIFCQLRDRDCLIVGGGDVAERKARLLLEAGARLTVNALTFIPQFTVWANEGMLTLVEGPFDETLLDSCWLAIAATDDDTVNQRVSEAAESRRIFCNVVDAPKAASFIMPSIIDRSPLMVAVSSGGTSPVLARLLREKLESLLPQHLGQVARYAGQLRARVKKQFATMGERRRFWEKFFVMTGWRSRWRMPMRKRLTRQPNTCLANRWITVAKSCWLAPGRAMPDCSR